MKYRNLGKNGFRVSEIGLGCWQLGGDWGEDPVEEDKALSILRAAVDAGVNLFDTADVYGGGRSEKIIGKFLRETHPEIRVITKFGQGDVYPDRYSEKSLRKGVEGSLDRLGLTSLDLLQLHCVPQAVLEKGDVFAWLRKLKKEGLIKNFGASVETETEGLICMEQEGLSSLQVIFNLFRQHYGQNFFSKASEKGVGIIVRLPLASGLLSGKFNRETRFSEKDHRNYNRDGAAFNVGETFSGLSFDKGLDLVESLKRHFLPEQMNMVEFSLRWILDHSAVSTIIPGASTVEQARANARISELSPLPLELHDKLSIFYTQEVLPHIRGPY